MWIMLHSHAETKSAQWRKKPESERIFLSHLCFISFWREAWRQILWLFCYLKKQLRIFFSAVLSSSEGYASGGLGEIQLFSTESRLPQIASVPDSPFSFCSMRPKLPLFCWLNRILDLSAVVRFVNLTALWSVLLPLSAPRRITTRRVR